MLEKVRRILYKLKGADAHTAVAHVVPLWLLLAVALTLVLLTWVTVAVTYVDLGKFNLVLALIIAGVKAFLVALFFMHLRWDRPFNGIVFLGAIAFVVLFISFAMLDTTQYQPNIIENYEPAIEQAQQAREQTTPPTAEPETAEAPAGSTP
jgi:cytochrome c oxidase subunit IV